MTITELKTQGYELYGELKFHPATVDREAFGGTVHGKPAHWTESGYLGRPMIWFGADGSGPARCVRTQRPVYGSGTQTDPYRFHADTADLIAQLRAHVLRMRSRYPSDRYPYRLGLCPQWPEVNA